MEYGTVMCGEYVDTSYAAALVEVFASLAELSQVRVILALGDDEVSANHLADILEMPSMEVQQHLAALEILEVVAVRARGSVRFFRLIDTHVRHLVFERAQKHNQGAGGEQV
jgi:DNA-binding transcriptional ArsR family regulator